VTHVMLEQTYNFLQTRMQVGHSTREVLVEPTLMIKAAESA